MGGIFISYRREDSAGWTGRLAEHLREVFGAESIFMDLDTIQPGADFTEALQTAVSSCDVLLAMIGPDWATATDRSGKLRLEDPTDWVRVEIAAALKRKIRVVPVLVGGASIPTVDLLPDDLDPLAQRQAHELTDRRWNYDVEQLVKTLPIARQQPPPHPEATPTASSTGSLRWAMPAILVIAAISAWIVSHSSPPHQDDGTQTAPRRASEVPSPSKSSAKPELDKPKPTTPPHVIHLRAGQEARLKDHRATCLYKVLAIQADQSRPDSVSLNVTVRVTNEGPSDTGFGDSNFRLLVDDVPQAPTNRLIDSIDPHSAKEATIMFAFPVTTQRLVLQLRMGKDVFESPLNLTPL